MTPPQNKTIDSEVQEPTIEWLIDQIAPNTGNSPLLNFNKDRLKKAIAQEANKRQQQLLDEILGGLPKDKQEMLNGKASVHHTWYNTALRDAKTVIESKLKQLNRGK